MDKDLIQKVNSAKTAEELLELAKSENIELTEEKAKKLFAGLRAEGEISDTELDNISGGGCGGGDRETNYKKIHSTDSACIYYQCDRCRGGRDSHTATCRIAINALNPDSSGFGRLFYNTCYGCYYGDFGDSLDGYCWNENTKY